MVIKICLYIKKNVKKVAKKKLKSTKLKSVTVHHSSNNTNNSEIELLCDQHKTVLFSIKKPSKSLKSPGCERFFLWDMFL